MSAANEELESSVPTILAHGFRPFFLLAGIWAMVPLVVVAWALRGGAWPARQLSVFEWHGHEMIFGFVAAAIAGFLLTAVPNWTGTRSASPLVLACLVLLWLSARISTLPFFVDGNVALGLLGLAFFPALAIALAGPLVRSRSIRNLPFLLFLALLFFGQLLATGPRFGWLTATAIDGMRLAVNIVILMIVIVGGRIVPAFTKSALAQMGRPVGVKRTRWIEVGAISSVVAMLLGDMAAQDSELVGVLAAIAAILLVLRVHGWYGWRTLDVPLLWVLHLGYCWLIVGLALKASWLLGGFDWAANWLHALTAGAFGTMILGVTTRAALGHTGRPLTVSGAIVSAYLLVSVATVLRVWGPAVAPNYYAQLLQLAIGAWLTAFGLYLLVYAPILARPRVDGRPG